MEVQYVRTSRKYVVCAFGAAGTPRCGAKATWRGVRLYRGYPMPDYVCNKHKKEIEAHDDYNS